MNGMPAPQGLYDPANEHDNCGVGFLANIDGVQSHRIVSDSIEVLKNLLHRGAVGGDFEQVSFDAFADEGVAVWQALGTGNFGGVKVRCRTAHIGPDRRTGAESSTGRTRVKAAGVHRRDDLVDARIAAPDAVVEDENVAGTGTIGFDPMGVML